MLLKNDYDQTRDVSPEVLSALIMNGKLNDNIQIKRDVIQAARFYSALNMVNEFTGGLPNLDRLKIVICGDRFGYLYNRRDDKCDPFDDVGESGGLFIVSVSYNYQIGSSLGLNLGSYDFHAFKENTTECFLIGCLGALVVTFNGKIPEKYSITIISVDGETRQIECRKGISSELRFVGNECFDSGVRFWQFSPDKLTVTIKWDDGSYSEVFKPIYDVRYPNGPRCRGVCKNGAISITLP